MLGLHAPPDVPPVSEPDRPAEVGDDAPTVPPDVEEPPVDLPGRESPGPRIRASR